MAGRFALIVATGADGEAAALADVLRNRRAGDFQAEVGGREQIEAFLAARERDDVVFMHVAAGAGVRIGALSRQVTRCASKHMLVVLEDDGRITLAHGRAIINGASATAVASALADADLDQDGSVSPRELYRRLRETAPEDRQPVLRSRLDGEYSVARSRFWRAVRRPLPEGPRSGLATGIVLLVCGILPPWVYGESGLKFAFWPGTPWPSRVTALAGLVLALAAGFVIWRRPRHGWIALVVLGTATWGCLSAWVRRFGYTDYGFGVLLTAAGTAFILFTACGAVLDAPEREYDRRLPVETVAGVAGAYAAVASVLDVGDRTGGVWLAAFLAAGAAATALLWPWLGNICSLCLVGAGAFVAAFHYTGPGSVHAIAAALVMLAGGLAGLRLRQP